MERRGVANLQTEKTIAEGYVPAPLPPPSGIHYDDEMVFLLAEAGRYIGHLDELSASFLLPTRCVSMYARREAVFSCRLEGSRATLTDLIKLEVGYREGLPEDTQEVENSLRALRFGFERIKEEPLSLRLVREVHGVLMHGMRGKQRRAGEFRRVQKTGKTEGLKAAYDMPPSVEHMWPLLDNFARFIAEEDRFHPLLVAALIQAQFEMLRPFVDGNGRVGRLLVGLYFAQEDIMARPTLGMSSFFLKNRYAYYARLLDIQERQGYDAWIRFFLQGVVESCTESIDLARQVRELREDDTVKLEQLGRAYEQAAKLYDSLLFKPVITVDEAAQLLSVAYTTAARLIDRFIELDILRLLEHRKRGRVFIYQRYVEVFD